MIQLIMILIKEKMKNNQKKYMRWKKAKNIIQNQINLKPMKEIREKIFNYLKVCKPPKKETMMIQLILILIKRQIMKNQRKYIGSKKEKNIQNQINQKLIKWIKEKINNYLKGCKPPKKETMMIQLILILIERQITKNQRKYIGQKKAKIIFRIR